MKKPDSRAFVPAALFLALSCSGDPSHGMTLSSSVFPAGGAIPKRHTCDGGDVSPPLSWSGVPAGTRSFALVVDDPDASGFTHWLLFDIPASTASLAEGLKSGTLPPGAAEGSNDSGSIGYRGPCPPAGSHHYSHRLYALDVASVSPTPPTKERFEASVRSHVLARAELIGTYNR
ncbi:MAG: YbhB/YbcL family Raf kinase inhibitor-like protein [Thermoanaerobaculia bacterium]